MKIPILCDRCSRPIEDWQQDFDAVAMRIVFTVRCHGAVDHCVIDYRDALEAGRIVEARAFRTDAVAALRPPAPPSNPTT